MLTVTLVDATNKQTKKKQTLIKLSLMWLSFLNQNLVQAGVTDKVTQKLHELRCELVNDEQLFPLFKKKITARILIFFFPLGMRKNPKFLNVFMTKYLYFFVDMSNKLHNLQIFSSYDKRGTH